MKNRSVHNAFSVQLERFEQAWQTGEIPPCIDDFLSDPDSDNEIRRSALWEFVAVDMEYRWKRTAGDPAVIARELAEETRAADSLPNHPLLEDYAASFPDIGSLAEIPLELIYEEYRIRCRWGDRPQHDEYQRRFRDRHEPLTSALSLIDAEVGSEFDHNHDTKPTVTRDTSDGASAQLSTQDLLGAVIDDYELVDEIARGGMGVVYKARQKKLNRIVALKMIRSGQLAGQSEIQRFQSEAEAAAKLDHPGIVPIFDVGQWRGHPYYTMGFVDGKNVGQRIKEKPLPPRIAAELLRSVADAVGYAHEQGIIHRDLKPANILLGEDGNPRVSDFGLAKQITADEALTVSGQVMGTPNYMPPEQALGQNDEVGPRSDVYALGAVLFELLTGRPPFQADNQLAVLKQVVEQDPVTPSYLNGAIDRDMDTICLKCLEKTPSRRYASATELADDLGRFLNGEPIRARPISAATKAWKWCRRKPLAATFCALLSTIAILAPIVAVHILRLQGEVEQGFRDKVDTQTQISEDLRDRPGMQPLREKWARTTLEDYKRILDQRGDDPNIREKAADAYFEFARITERISDDQEAIEAYEQALEFHLRLVRAVPADPNFRFQLARIHLHLEALYRKNGELDRSRSAYSLAAQSLEFLVAKLPDHLTYRIELARLYGDVETIKSLTAIDGGEDAEYLETRVKGLKDIALTESPDNAVKYYDTAIEITERLIGRFPNSLSFRHEIGSLYKARAINTSDDIEAEKVFHKALEIHQELVESNPSVVPFESEFGRVSDQFAFRLQQMGKLNESEALYQQAEGIFKQLCEKNPHNIEDRQFLAMINVGIALVQRDRKEYERSLATFDRVLAVQKALVAEFPSKVSLRVDLAGTYNNIARTYQAWEKPAQARESYIHARETVSPMMETDTVTYDSVRILCNAGNQIVTSFISTRNIAQADQELRRWKEILRRLEPTNPTNDLILASYDRIGHLHYMIGKNNESGKSGDPISDYTHAVRNWDKVIPPRPDVHYNKACALSLSATLTGDNEQAKSEFSKRALDELRNAVQSGFSDHEKLRSNPDFESIREHPEFDRIARP